MGKPGKGAGVRSHKRNKAAEERREVTKRTEGLQKNFRFGVLLTCECGMARQQHKKHIQALMKKYDVSGSGNLSVNAAERARNSSF